MSNQKLSEEGYTIKILKNQARHSSQDPGQGEDPFDVVCLDKNGEEIGHAEIFFYGPERLMMCSDVWVDELHRRKGIATAMYFFAESLTGHKMHPYPVQYEDGKKFWKNKKK